MLLEFHVILHKLLRQLFVWFSSVSESTGGLELCSWDLTYLHTVECSNRNHDSL